MEGRTFMDTNNGYNYKYHFNYYASKGFKMPIIKLLFEIAAKFSPKKASFQNKWISIHDFYMLFLEAGLLQYDISEEDLYLIFLQSMMLQEDELNKPKHFQMTLIEFIEALARVAEKVSPSSPTYKEKKLTSIQKAILPLFVKFEGLLFILYHRLLNSFSKGSNEVEILNKRSILGTHQARNLGIYQSDSSSSNESFDSNQSYKASSKDPESQIQRLLQDFDYDADIDISPEKKGKLMRKRTLRNLSKVLPLKKSAQNSNWAKLKQFAHNSKLRQSVMEMGLNRSISKTLKIVTQQVEEQEKIMIQEASPFRRQQLLQTKQRRSQFYNIEQKLKELN